MATNLHPVLTPRIFREEKCYGRGIHELLQRVDEHHSLRAAAQSMGMAYSKAWTIVRHCEQELGFPLLHSVTGGKHGGGATVTSEARRIMETYERFNQRLQEAAQSIFLEEFREYL